MRSFALFTLTVALGSAACNDQQSAMGTETEGTTSSITGQPATSSTPETSTTTTGEPGIPETTTTAPMTTEPMSPTTGPAETSTTTTGDETTTTTTGTTEPDTTGEPVEPDAKPYESCSNEMDIDCQGNAVCLDAANTMGKVKGSYCAPKCSGGPMNCMEPNDIGPNTHAICAFDTNGDNAADTCALLCNLAADDCNNGSTCEDIGIAPMDVNGVLMEFGICTHAP